MPGRPYARLVQRIVLVMAEYGVDDSPLWSRGGFEDAGLVDAGSLGLSEGLRTRLRAWNDAYDDRPEPDFAWPSDAAAVAHRTESFALASAVQLELGDDTVVWCGAGDGIDCWTESGRWVLLSADRHGTDVEHRVDGRADVRTVLEAGAWSQSARAVMAWRARTERAGGAAGDAASRALGLRAAGQLQADLGLGARVLFLGGARG